MRFWLPWWLFPIYLLVWICFLPVRLVLALFDSRRRRVERGTVRIQIQVRDHEKSPSQPEG